MLYKYMVYGILQGPSMAYMVYDIECMVYCIRELLKIKGPYSVYIVYAV